MHGKEADLSPVHLLRDTLHEMLDSQDHLPRTLPWSDLTPTCCKPHHQHFLDLFPRLSVCVADVDVPAVDLNEQRPRRVNEVLVQSMCSGTRIVGQMAMYVADQGLLLSPETSNGREVMCRRMWVPGLFSALSAQFSSSA
ncbi:hypothetical protein EW146_g9469 [Bondarzewia mesenterica]|uniref:Uncharacterized protein n=1 Tax=Bondarzewia mesenterica TaxID=1095465 RepID=A0A4S4L6H9_9AGAM|nr:hypothetical protein EW146_g9469 [Bondarzewia mesenterica]